MTTTTRRLRWELALPEGFRVERENETSRFTSKRCRSCTTITSVLATRVRLSCAPWGAWRLETGRFQHVQGSGPSSSVVVACRGCGAWVYALEVRGKVRADVPCDARCVSARGHSCECSCGGRNHGAAHSAA